VSPPQEPVRAGRAAECMTARQPVPDWLASTAGEEVQNLALSRLRQAAQKNKADGEKVRGTVNKLHSAPHRTRLAGQRSGLQPDPSDGEPRPPGQGGESPAACAQRCTTLLAAVGRDPALLRHGAE
jgi:hypothetical protein